MEAFAAQSFAVARIGAVAYCFVFLNFTFHITEYFDKQTCPTFALWQAGSFSGQTFKL